MDKSEILALLDELEPQRTNVSEALAFIRLVVSNNPLKSAADISKRPDVKQAQAVLLDWVDRAETVVKEVVKDLPKSARNVVFEDSNKTLESFKKDVTITEVRVSEWLADENNATRWSASIVLRMTWYVDWLRRIHEFSNFDAPYKRWVCQMRENSCSYCKAMNGTILSKGRSFASKAKQVGFKRVYGGLYAPGLHPRCLCFLVPATKEEYDAYRAGTLGS